MVTRWQAGMYIVIAFMLFFTVNVISELAFTKYNIDLTEDGIFTLSNGTKKIIEEVEEPIRIQFFYSNKVISSIPIVKSFAARVRGLLEQYESYSDGLIDIEIIDPRPFSDEEDIAVSYGIKGVDTDQMGTKAYLGMTLTNSVDDTKTIPFLALEREKFLEYELTRAIYDLANPKRKKIGLLSTIKMGSGPFLGIKEMGGSSSWLVIQQMSKIFDIVTIDQTATKIPSDIDVLMLVQPRGLSEQTLYAVDQFVLGGGRAVMFVDPNKEGAGTGNPAERSFSSNFNVLLNSWGVDIDPSKVVGDRIAARPYDRDGKDKQKYVNYLAWLKLKEQNISRDDITTAQLKTIHFNTVGMIKKTNTSSIEVKPLIWSNSDSNRISVSKVRTRLNPNELLRFFASNNTEYTLAARLTGMAKTAYPGYSERADHLSKSKSPINVVLIADTDVIRDEVWSTTQDFQGYKVVNTLADNISFVINVLDHLSGSGDLISLRGRGEAKRPFVKVEELKRVAEKKYLAKENQLKGELNNTELRLANLQKMAKAQAGNKLAYKSQQQQEIKKFSEHMLKVKKELRKVQGELRKSIDSLGTTVKFVNIWLMPLLVTCLAVFIFFIRKRIVS